MEVKIVIFSFAALNSWAFGQYGVIFPHDRVGSRSWEGSVVPLDQDDQKCSYGEADSFTVTCYNVTSSSYFKMTTYNFDELDETLECLNCQLTAIRSYNFDFSSGNRIKVLDLHDSLINMIEPKSFIDLIFLKKMNLSHNRIENIEPGTFTGVKKIEDLDLSRNNISFLINYGFAELQELRILNLKQNTIRNINNKAFINLTKLQQLDLSFNEIDAMNQSFDNLTSLQMLDLSHNRITVLNGEEYSNLLELNSLDLSWNFIRKLNLFMKPGNNLRTISLNHNQMTVWSNVSNLDVLEELNLENNNIISISIIALKNLLSLHRLRLSYNQLTQLWTGKLYGLPQLRELNCSHNSIKNVPITGVFSLQNLHTLDLSHNHIEDLDYTGLISRVPSLSYLRLEDNPLPCELERQMEKHFEEDNFKFFLWDGLGPKGCIEKPVKSSPRTKQLKDSYIENNSVKGVDLAIFVLIAIIMVLIGTLYLFQFMFYRGMKMIQLERVDDTVQLINDDRINTTGLIIYECDRIV